MKEVFNYNNDNEVVEEEDEQTVSFILLFFFDFYCSQKKSFSMLYFKVTKLNQYKYFRFVKLLINFFLANKQKYTFNLKNKMVT